MESVEKMTSELSGEDKAFVEEVARQDCIVSYKYKDGVISMKAKGHPANIANAICEIIDRFVTNSKDKAHKFAFLKVIQQECEEHLRKIEGEADGI